MPKLFQFNATEHMKLGDDPKVFIISETDKAGNSAHYLISAWIPPGPIGNAASGSGFTFENAISKEMFDVMKASGKFSVVEFRQQPDSPCQQFQGDWDAVQFQLRAAYTKLNQQLMGSPAWQQIYFSEVSPLMMKALQIELAAGAAGCRIEKAGK